MTCFYSVALLLSTFGSRFLHDDLDDDIKKFLNEPIIKLFTLFCLVYVTTRDTYTAIISSILYGILINGKKLSNKIRLT